MPKVISLPSLPISSVFAVAKPSGPTCMSLVMSLQPLLNSSRLFATDAERAAAQSKGKYKNVLPTAGYMLGVDSACYQVLRVTATRRKKSGKGKTLDPLADGVLVLGVNDATNLKKLGGFLKCTKARTLQLSYIGLADTRFARQ